MSNPRAPSPAGRLAALGFGDTAAALRVLTEDIRLEVTGADAPVVEALAGAAEPGLALAGLARLEPDRALLTGLRADPDLRARLAAVLGTSTALSEHLRRHRGDWRLLTGPAAGLRPAAGQLTADLTAARSSDQLKLAYRRWLLRLAAADLTGAAPLGEVMTGLSDLAGAALEAAYRLARAALPAGAAPCRLAVIAMGKCGACELNYASDVDVIFVAEPAEPGGTGDEEAALRTATQLASGLIRICSDAGQEGSLFPVDPNLRPEGRNGPLVRTLASHLAYYQRWAKTWEFQALLKARPVAGDAGLGRAYADAVAPLVWTAAQREDFVPDVQAMRRRVVASLPAAQAGRELKLGPGGLRDIEFAVQLLQLVHGRADESLRDRATLPALDALARGGYVGRADAAALAEAYEFLRVVEHLLQLRQLRRTHQLPDDPAVLRQLGRAMRVMGYPIRPEDTSADPAQELTVTWRRHAATARQLHEKLFYRPLLEAVARLPGDVMRLTSEAAAARLEALGYADPAGALRHIAALTDGVSRKAAIQRALLPAMLGWFADAPRPDAGLLAFRQVSEALGNSPWYLRLLRDDTNVAWRMARLLASSRYAADLLLRAPEAVAMLGSEQLLRPADPAGLLSEGQALVRRNPGRDGAGGPPAAAAGLLALRRRELLRTAAADVLGLLEAEQAAAALSEVTAVTVAGALDLAATAADGQVTMAVIAMGRFGGQEVGYGSDADVLFVYEPAPGADEQAAARTAHATAEELRRLLGRPGPDPALRVDADLRPEGRQGPLVRTLGAYRAYYGRWAKPWEVQALLRASPVAGDGALGEAFAAMADEVRYPAGGLAEASVREVKRIKARMEAERMPRGVEPALHLKLGPGGLTDTEWVAQLIQLRHAWSVPELRTTRTLPALDAAAGAGLIAAADAAALRESWLLATRIRNAIMLATGRAADVVPAGHGELSATARVLGYPPDGAQDLVQDWRRTARRSRAVMERLFYG
ncbi:MAG TPA: bifunctional [glutamine synthetase] adenylyltransferase/[glutamine synthetase]-adenylyl-L-tyrosine phosphorylase [Streptosporangiaceae bacterium]